MKIIFLDRDGVINRYPGHGGYVTKVKDFHFLPGSLQAIGRLTQLGYTLFIISNQAGVSRGVYSKHKLNLITRHMLQNIRHTGGRIKKVFYCIHRSDENCECRKPKIGSIKEALQLVNKSLKHARKSYFVGDADSDVEAGYRAGCKTIFVLSGRNNRQDVKKWNIKPTHIAKNLLEAAKIIEHENSHRSRHSGRRA